MIEVPLTQGKVALVCECHYHLVKDFKWQALQSHLRRDLWYARRTVRIDGKRTAIHMHRVISGASEEFHVDHKNHDGLDNRCENLRPCTRSENQHNRRVQSNKKWSKHKGVHWGRRQRKWVATIYLNGKNVHLGYHSSESEAASAYRKRANAEFGAFAC